MAGVKYAKLRGAAIFLRQGGSPSVPTAHVPRELDYSRIGALRVIAELLVIPIDQRTGGQGRISQ
jgi:hypothetical protein